MIFSTLHCFYLILKIYSTFHHFGRYTYATSFFIFISVTTNKYLKEIIIQTNTFNFAFLLNRCSRLIGAMLTLTLMMPTLAFSQTTVDLGSASNFGILASAAITSSSVVTGDVGTTAGGVGDVSVASGYTIYDYTILAFKDIVDAAQTDLTIAYSDAETREGATILAAGDYSLPTYGTFSPGIYKIGGNATMPTNVTLSGSGVYIFQITGFLTTAANIILTNGAVWTDIFWQIGNYASLGASFTFNGNVMANGYITVGAENAIVNSRLLSKTAAVTAAGSTVGGSEIPVPVELTSFTAALNNNAVELNWNTATEVNNYGFEVERLAISDKLLANDWSKIGFVEGHGNSNSPKDYSFEDNNPPIEILQYRLKQIDFDGKFEYSDVVEVNYDAPVKFVLDQNYPNPFNPTTKISYEIPVKANVVIIVYDVLGSEVVALLNEDKLPGRYQVEFNAPNLTSGIYFYSINAGEYKSIKKMILLK